MIAGDCRRYTYSNAYCATTCMRDVTAVVDRDPSENLAGVRIFPALPLAVAQPVGFQMHESVGQLAENHFFCRHTLIAGPIASLHPPHGAVTFSSRSPSSGLAENCTSSIVAMLGAPVERAGRRPRYDPGETRKPCSSHVRRPRHVVEVGHEYSAIDSVLGCRPISPGLRRSIFDDLAERHV